MLRNDGRRTGPIGSLSGFANAVWIISAICAVFVSLPPGLLEAHHLSRDNVAFSPFEEAHHMEPGWADRKVQYEDWAKGADLAVTLDQHLYPVLLPFVRKFALKYDVDIAVKEGTCGISAGLIAKKNVDVAGFCCPPGRADRLPGLTYHTVGIAPLAIIVHPDNPVRDISLKDARRLFSGEAAHWREVSAEHKDAGPVRPVGRLHCKARPGHWRLLLEDEDQFGPRLTEVGSIPDMMIAVSSERSAIGHVATWNIHKYSDAYSVKALSIDGIDPMTAEIEKALRENRYPIYRAYNITSWSGGNNANGLADKLVKYLLDIATEIDARFSLVPAEELRKNGWIFNGDELVGEPEDLTAR